jgi:hypothetical protein
VWAVAILLLGLVAATLALNGVLCYEKARFGSGLSPIPLLAGALGALALLVPYHHGRAAALAALGGALVPTALDFALWVVCFWLGHRRAVTVR